MPGNRKKTPDSAGEDKEKGGDVSILRLPRSPSEGDIVPPSAGKEYSTKVLPHKKHEQSWQRKTTARANAR